MESCRDSMLRPSREWSVYLLGSGCQRYQWALWSWWHHWKSNSIKARSGSFWCSRTVACRKWASCVARCCSSWAQENSFFPQQAEEKSLSEPHEVATEKLDFQSSCYSPEAILGRGSEFYVRFDSIGFSWEVSPKWADRRVARVFQMCFP